MKLLILLSIVITLGHSDIIESTNVEKEIIFHKLFLEKIQRDSVLKYTKAIKLRYHGEKKLSKISKNVGNSIRIGVGAIPQVK